MRISDWSSDVCSSDLWLFLEAGDITNFIEDVHCLAHQDFLDAGEMHIHNGLHRFPVREFDIMEETAAQESIRQFLLLIRCDDDDRAFLCLHCLACLVDVELHAVEFLEQVIRELDVSLRSEEHTSELQSLMRISYAVFCLKKKK